MANIIFKLEAQPPYTEPPPSGVDFIFIDTGRDEFPSEREEFYMEIYQYPDLLAVVEDNENILLEYYEVPTRDPELSDSKLTDVGFLLKFDDTEEPLLNSSVSGITMYDIDDDQIKLVDGLYGLSLSSRNTIAPEETNGLFDFSNNFTIEFSIEFGYYTEIEFTFGDSPDYTETRTISFYNVYKEIGIGSYDSILDENSYEALSSFEFEAYRKYDIAVVKDTGFLRIYIDGNLISNTGVDDITTNELTFYTNENGDNRFDEIRYTASARYTGASYVPKLPFSTIAGDADPTGTGSNVIEDAESSAAASVLIIGSSSWETEGFIQTSSGIVGVKVFGTVRDDLNNLASRTVRLHNRSTGALISEGASDPVTGAFVLNAIENEYMYLVVFDNLAGPKNAKIYDKIFIAS